MHVFRSATASHFKEKPERISDQALITKHGLMAPYTLVRLARLSLAIRVMSRCNGDLLRLLYVTRLSAKSWMAAVLDDLAWLQIVSPGYSTFRNSADWFRFFRENPKLAKKWIKKTCASPEANILACGASTDAIAQIGQDWPFDECARVFRTKSALKTHKFDMHQTTRITRWHVDESATCHFCMLQFPTPLACVRHLEANSPICKAYMTTCIPPLPVRLEGIAFWKPPKNRLAAVRLEGPTPFFDDEELPIEIALNWDQSTRHPLGQ